MRKRIYIAGPITRGNRTDNFANACKAQESLMACGFAPLNPMLTMLHPAAWVIPHEDWMAADLPWVAVADGLLRLPGDSIGADMEVAHAMKLGIPVMYSITEVLTRFAE